MEFDFERGLEAQVGQPVEPPANVPAAGRKNYRMVRDRALWPLLVPRTEGDGAAAAAALQHCARSPPPLARALLPRLRLSSQRGPLACVYDCPPSASSSRDSPLAPPLQTVCRHWLRGLCMKGNSCGFLHQFEASRMPVCRFFAKYGECKEPDCPFKHSDQDIKDCNMYKLGFCIHGPQCRFRHQKQPGPPPSAEQAHLTVTRCDDAASTPRIRLSLKPSASKQTGQAWILRGRSLVMMTCVVLHVAR